MQITILFVLKKISHDHLHWKDEEMMNGGRYDKLNLF
jgi:hypothetical protein